MKYHVCSKPFARDVANNLGMQKLKTASLPPSLVLSSDVLKKSLGFYIWSSILGDMFPNRRTIGPNPDSGKINLKHFAPVQEGMHMDAALHHYSR